MARSKHWAVALVLLMVACGTAAQATPIPTTVPPLSATATPTRAPVATATPAATPTVVRAPAPTAASTGPAYGGVLRYPQREDPSTWDPSMFHTDPLQLTKFLTFSKLFTEWGEPVTNCQKSLVPQVIDKWRWVDDTTAEFVLKPGVKYQNRPPANGRELVAADVVPSFARYQKNLSFMAGQSVRVASVVATDKYTFQMKMASPWGSLITELLGHMYGPWAEPAEVASSTYGWSDPAKSWVGSGPFMFEEWKPGVKWTLVRNPDYFKKGKPYLDRVEFAVMPDSSTQLTALRAGKLNMVLDFSEPLLAELVRAVPGTQVVRCTGAVLTGSGSLWMNTTAPPFNDVRVRRAVSMSIDRQTIIDKLYGGKASNSLVLASATVGALALSDYPAETQEYLKYNSARAKQLLAEAGYPNGFDTAISFTVRYAAPANAIAEAIVEMLNAAGIRAKLNMMEYSRYSGTVLQANYPAGEMAITPATAQTPEDAHALRTFYSKSGAVNRSLVKDPEYDKLYETFVATTDEAKRTQLLRQLQLYAGEKAYRVLLPMADSTMTGLPGVRFSWLGNTKDFAGLFESVWMEK